MEPGFARRQGPTDATDGAVVCVGPVSALRRQRPRGGGFALATARSSPFPDSLGETDAAGWRAWSGDGPGPRPPVRRRSVPGAIGPLTSAGMSA